MRAKYTSKKTRDEEEPMLDRSTVPLLCSHILENGRVHPVQPGLRLVEEARRRMRIRVAENVARPVPEIYKEVHEEIIALCEEPDREELTALFPSLRAMDTALYRWRKGGGSVELTRREEEKENPKKVEVIKSAGKSPTTLNTQIANHTPAQTMSLRKKSTTPRNIKQILPQL